MRKSLLTFIAALFATAAFAQSSSVWSDVSLPAYLQKSLSEAALQSQTYPISDEQMKLIGERQALLGPPTALKEPAEGLITDQPDGTLYTNYYGEHKGYWVFLFWVPIPMLAGVNGAADHVVIADDGSVYFQNPFCYYLTNSWLKGHFNEAKDSVIVDLPQPIYYRPQSSEYSEYTFLAAKCNMDAEQGTWVGDMTPNHIAFSYSPDGTMVWNGESTRTLLGLTDDSGYWYGYGDLNKSYRLVDYTADLPSETASPAEDYILTYNSDDSDPDNILREQKFVKLIRDGQDAYVTNLTAEDDSIFVKLERTDDGYTLKGEQYLGIHLSDNRPFYLFAQPYDWKSVYDSDNKEYTDSLFKMDELKYAYAEDTKTFTGENKYFRVDFGNGNVLSYVGYWKSPMLRPYSKVNAKPEAPVITRYIDYYEAAGYHSLVFTLKSYDKDLNYLDPDCITYSLFLDDDSEPYVFFADDYESLTEDLTEVPYLYYDNKDIYKLNSINERNLHIFADAFTKVGIQEYYHGSDGETYASDITWYVTDPAGIQQNFITDNGKTTATERYFDLSGRQVSKPQHGVFVKKATFTDGTTATKKIVLK